jgi:hypothetical protein
MRYNEILELKKRIDFNSTEPEVLIRLIESARNKGEKLQEDLRILQRISSKIVDSLDNKKFIFGREVLDKVELSEKRAVGIDGSFQLVGGTGGKWYAPISVARIIFENGPSSKPYVDIFWADIEEIDETEDSDPRKIASLKMLRAESTAILNWCTQNKRSIVFIDGPIVDPPTGSLEEYVEYRSEGIKKCLENSIVIGCVKRSRDRFFIRHLEGILFTVIPDVEKYLDKFLTDQHLMLHVFAYIRSKGKEGPIFTKWIDISSANQDYELYSKYGVYVVSLFYQKNKASSVLRLDIPLLKPPDNDQKTNEIILQAVKAVDEWIYPGHDYPLPIYLAHEKSSIREGCAQVLYEEIITKSRTTNESDQLILMLLR